MFSDRFQILQFSFIPGCYSFENAYYVDKKNKVSNPRVAFGHSIQLPTAIDTVGDYCIDSLTGTWRWIKSVGGIWGTMHAKDSDSILVKIRKDSVFICSKDYLILKNTYQNVFENHYYFRNMDLTVIDDTPYASQPIQCCDIPYLYVFHRIKYKTRIFHSKNILSKSTFSSETSLRTFDIRGRYLPDLKRVTPGTVIQSTNNTVTGGKKKLLIKTK